jgi:hypothetical protein
VSKIFVYTDIWLPRWTLWSKYNGFHADPSHAFTQELHGGVARGIYGRNNRVQAEAKSFLGSIHSSPISLARRNIVTCPLIRLGGDCASL